MFSGQTEAGGGRPLTFLLPEFVFCLKSVGTFTLMDFTNRVEHNNTFWIGALACWPLGARGDFLFWHTVNCQLDQRQH